MLNDSFYEISHLAKTDIAVECAVKFNAAHTIFAGHFPGLPVVPGVCLMQIVKEVLELALDQTVILKKADYLKFIAPVVPHANQVLQLQVKYSAVNEQAMKVSATLSADTVTCFKLQGVFRQMV